MHILQKEDGSFVISEVDGNLREMICAIPVAAETDDSEAARRRIFPDPASGPDTADLREEWREYVEPGLRHLFEDAMVTVQTDLEHLDENGVLPVPAAHVDAWLNALNQARLALAAKFDIGEAEMDELTSRPKNERDFAVLQIHLYGFIQECLVRGALGGSLDEEEEQE